MPAEGIRLIDHSSVLSFEEIAEFTRCAVELGICKVRLTGGEPLARKGTAHLVRMLSSIGGIEDLSMTTNAILLPRYAVALKQAGLHRVNISLDTIDEAGLSPIKINCVILDSPDEPDALAVKRFCEEQGLIPRFIKQMDIEKGSFGVVHGGSGGHCASCNRLRLTSDGLLKPCLFNDVAFDIRKMDYREALRMAVDQKPQAGARSNSHKFYNIGG
jgi:cyclic pyranopterin phosphate synthase